MTNQNIAGFKSKRIIMAMMLAVGSMMTMASTATAATLKVSVENLAPTNGVTLAPVWFGFHDGSFDTFNVDDTASSGIELLAEEGVTGLEDSTIPGAIDDAIAAGLDPSKLPDPSSTLASLFAASSAGVNGGTQSMVFANTRSPFFLVQFPGKTETTTITLNGSIPNNRYFSYASMLLPSNDAFIANDDPKEIEIFDDKGKFIGADFIVSGNQVWDAGTEVNDEAPLNIPYTLKEVGNSVDENGTIQLHPALKAPGEGGIVDFELDGEKVFANADFTDPGYQAARITVTQVPEPDTTTGVLALGGLFLLCRWFVRSRASNAWLTK